MGQFAAIFGDLFQCAPFLGRPGLCGKSGDCARARSPPNCFWLAYFWQIGGPGQANIQGEMLPFVVFVVFPGRPPAYLANAACAPQTATIPLRPEEIHADGPDLGGGGGGGRNLGDVYLSTIKRGEPIIDDKKVEIALSFNTRWP